ncbi:hypothetical protein B0H63DRAFT_475082 [Podospora didyma]|uniref:NmrA-like domain-containing protein n=1 Tax=Podospora didyma TaxID=330526 RepID=A0AAE0NGN1_9PEZI|nr:hypothetical protein B0H63DRAFT_475082 [Podospora didyma]
MTHSQYHSPTKIMSAPLKNIAITGAAGSLGSVVFKTLLDAGKFNIRVLRRAGSSSTFPAGVEVVDVDFKSPSSLKSALVGQDAVVNTMASYVDNTPHTALATAAFEAGVKRFIPAEFGANLDSAATRALPIFAGKVEVQDYLAQAVKTNPEGTSYTLIYNAAFLDWGLQNDFILAISEAKPIILNGGDLPFSTTTLQSVADAVVGVLTHPAETKNRAVHVHDIVLTQNRLLALAKQVAPNRDWQPVPADMDTLIAAAGEKMSRGIFDKDSIFSFLYRATFDPACGCAFDATDNELLGIKGKTEEDVIELLKTYLA